MLDDIEHVRRWTDSLAIEYDDVAAAEVWRIVVDDLVLLKNAVESMIGTQ